MNAFAGEQCTLAGYRTRLRVCGDGPNALVLFPAVMDSATSFGRLQLLLRRRLGQGFATASVELPGYGQLDAVPGFETWPDFCRELARVLNQHFPEQLVFAGNSSGAVAATYAALAAQRCAGLALLCWCDWQKTPPRSAELLCPQDAGRLERLHALAWHTPPALAPASVSAALALASRNRAHVASFDAPIYRAALARYRGPLLVVAGASDGLVPAADARDTACAHPGAELTVLAHCGHYPHRERPGELASQLAQFTRRAVAARTCGERHAG